MLRQLIIEERRFPLAVPFRISRGVKLNADVVTVAMYQGDKCGRGEAVPYARYGESVASVIEQMEQLRPQLASGMGRDELLAQLPAGAARNALDAAMWDLESQLSGVPVWQRLARTPGTAVVTALTVGIDTPEQMGVAAARIAGVGLIKVKVDADDPAARIDAVRRAAPHARLIVDPNESWTIDLLRDMQGPLARARVDLLEQPLPADADDALSPACQTGPVWCAGVINADRATGSACEGAMTPTLVLRDGKLFMLTGSPGDGTIISTTMESIVNVIDFGMNLQQSINAPRMHQQWFPQTVFVEPGLMTPQTRQTLEAMGHTFTLRDAIGADEAIMINPRNGLLEGANDRRRPAGLAAGY
ncbi:gamma-glutamyltransferase [Rhodanobacter lindaniclasticus]